MIQCKTSKAISGMGHSMKRKEDARFLQGKGNYVIPLQLIYLRAANINTQDFVTGVDNQVTDGVFVEKK